jgi:hypothetical protein
MQEGDQRAQSPSTRSEHLHETPNEPYVPALAAASAESTELGISLGTSFVALFVAAFIFCYFYGWQSPPSALTKFSI